MNNILRIATENGGRMVTWKFMKMNREINEDEQASFTDAAIHVSLAGGPFWAKHFCGWMGTATRSRRSFKCDVHRQIKETHHHAPNAVELGLEVSVWRHRRRDDFYASGNQRADSQFQRRPRRSPE